MSKISDSPRAWPGSDAPLSNAQGFSAPWRRDDVCRAAGWHRAFFHPHAFIAFWRLHVYGCTLAAIYGTMLVSLYESGHWMVDSAGVPIYTDFTEFWTGATLALQGDMASVYEPAAFRKIQDALVGAGHSVFSIWPYPPTYFLFLAPFATLPYTAAFLAWDLVTLFGCVAVVCLTVGRPQAIAFVLAWPFTLLNFSCGQTGFLTAALLGGSLLFLEHRPLMAGVFIGLLTYKPQFGMLIPVVLLAAGEWRAFASAVGVTILLAGISAAAFGIGAWAAFPREIASQAGVNLFADADSRWGLLQSFYGLIRAVHGGAVLAWVVQALTTLGVAIIVWLVWRSPMRFALKAATLSAAALLATPYALAPDMAAVVIPAAFLARDQIRDGWLRGEQAAMIMLFAASLFALITAGQATIGPPIVLALLCLILRRVIQSVSPKLRMTKICEKFLR
jgi:arabinofuranan 3-O-arabinosyltransferase